MSMRILVVDDFGTMIRIIKNVLSELGYDNIIKPLTAATLGEKIKFALHKKA